jgi:hypothetical protein
MKKLTFRVHAIEKMFERGISRDDVRHVIDTGEVIHTYPDDTPYASRLILGWRDERPLHVVAADNETEDVTIIITAYEPNAALWEPDFRKKKDQDP